MLSLRLLVAVLSLTSLAAAFSPASTDSTKINAFKQWLETNKLPPHKVVVNDKSRLETTETIEKGEIMLSVPFKFLMSPKGAGESKVGEAFKQIALPSSIIMALYLIHEKNDPQSFWKPWLDILPETVPSTLSFDQKEMAELEGSMMQSITARRQAAIAQEHELVLRTLQVNYTALFPNETFTLEAYRWATTIVSSRSIIVTSGNVTVPLLVPYVDLAQHDHTVNTTYEFDEDNNFKVVTNQQFNASQPVKISIGGRSNGQLILSHGLTLDNNDYDQVQLNVQVSEDDPFASVKRKILEQAGFGPDRAYVITKAGLSRDLLAAMRIQALKPSEFDSYTKAFSNQPVSLRNELEVYRTLILACQNLLKRYKTTLQQDAELLQTDLSANVRNAVILRKGEKETLLVTMNLIARLWDDFLVRGYPGEQ
jgi:histone-lysine N-methyltransferase SETD3